MTLQLTKMGTVEVRNFPSGIVVSEVNSLTHKVLLSLVKQSVSNDIRILLTRQCSEW